MRKTKKENMGGTITCSAANLKILECEGYRYVLVRGLTIDGHYEYVDPYYILLVPMKTLPSEQAEMDIYEPIDSALLLKWASAENEYPKILLVTSQANHKQ